MELRADQGEEWCGPDVQAIMMWEAGAIQMEWYEEVIEKTRKTLGMNALSSCCPMDTRRCLTD